MSLQSIWIALQIYKSFANEQHLKEYLKQKCYNLIDCSTKGKNRYKQIKNFTYM